MQRLSQALHGEGRFESSPVPMTHWLQAIYLMSASKKGISANPLHRTLGCTLKTAWFISHVDEAMRPLAFEPMGADGAIVEADETSIGRLVNREAKTDGRTRTSF
jgi:hypothetical protein